MVECIHGQLFTITSSILVAYSYLLIVEHRSTLLTPHQPDPHSQPHPHSTQKPVILLYHALHGSTTWWFHMTDNDFRNCNYTCQVTSDKTLFPSADMVIFESPKRIRKRVNGTIYLDYYKDWGDWPPALGNPKQVRIFFSREPQTAGLSGEQMDFMRFMFNYTVTFQKNADIFYPYGHIVKLRQSIPVEGEGFTRSVWSCHSGL